MRYLAAMKAVLFGLLIGSLFFLTGCLGAFTDWFAPLPGNPEVIFPDLNLEKAIREAIDKPYGPIFRSDLISLTHLDAQGAWSRRISDLTGIEYLANLTWLDLEDNRIVDIGPLAGPIKLTELDLEDNRITCIDPLAGLINLTRLRLEDNRIADIAPLAELTKLTRLDLDFNDIICIDPLAKLTKLTRLDLDFNDIICIGPLAGLINLNRLWLRGNEIRDLAPLVANNGLGTGDRVDLRDNPLDPDYMLDVGKLRERGVEVWL